MAKGTGLIGNFKGKVGNTVGYKLSASNNGQTQGIRVYQPIVKNPKTAAQAEQRAKLLAVNATYRALKMVIDRGNEGLPYGNKSRLAWLKGALKATNMPWFEKGSNANYPVGCRISQGSIPTISYTVVTDTINISCVGATEASPVNTIGGISTLLLAAYDFLREGDQITIGLGCDGSANMVFDVFSFIINSTSAEPCTEFTADANKLSYEPYGGGSAGFIIVSRLGENGEHLRSTTNLNVDNAILAEAPYDADSKAAAIASYQSSGYVNADWQEESIQ